MSNSELNRSITLSEEERQRYRLRLLKIHGPVSLEQILDRVSNHDIFEVVDLLPPTFVDLLFVDPPYNLPKVFNARRFRPLPIDQYTEWMDSWLGKLTRLLKPRASVYICSDWRTSAAVHLLCEKYFIVRNRITFEREKGRAAKTNWKSNSEDIWFCTVSGSYTFNAEAVRLKKRVVAPYRQDGAPKGWSEGADGKYRMTYPSNVWTDITIPFWSMPENTPHPTQKPEKLLARVVLASSREGDVVFDPFAGVGTTGVVAKKLARRFVMVEIDEEYCLYTEKRLEMAGRDKTIQGYADGVFWERNALKAGRSGAALRHGDGGSLTLFPQAEET